MLGYERQEMVEAVRSKREAGILPFVERHELLPEVPDRGRIPGQGLPYGDLGSVPLGAHRLPAFTGSKARMIFLAN